MHDEETWLWRIQWAGRWCNSRHQCTEEQIRKEHPEATRIEGSRRIQSLPDSQEEKNQLQYNNTSAFLAHRLRPDGSTMLLSEYPVVVSPMREGWGAKVIDQLASDLHHEFPNMSGFSPCNLK